MRTLTLLVAARLLLPGCSWCCRPAVSGVLLQCPRPSGVSLLLQLRQRDQEVRGRIPNPHALLQRKGLVAPDEIEQAFELFPLVTLQQS